MPSPAQQNPPPFDRVLDHRDFIRSIVRSLLRDGDGGGVDDLVQQTLVQAWRAEPPARTGLRPWLARIARNLTLDHLRSKRSRLQRERRATPPAELPSPQAILQHEEERRRVVRAVIALPEHYRTVLLLRFWEELTPAEIAHRLGQPGASIRSRLRRGLALLRDRLDDEYGTRAAWTTALLPFATPGWLASAAASAAGAANAATPAATQLTTTKALLMTQSKTTLTAALLIAAGCLALWATLRDPAPAPLDQGASSPVAGTTSRATAEPQPQAGTTASESHARSRSTASLGSQTTIRGQVLHDGKPYPDFAVTLQWFAGMDTKATPQSEHQLRSDADGRFVWRGKTKDELRTVRAISLTPHVKCWNATEVVPPESQDVALRLTVVPFDRRLSGQVRSVDGTPIAGAHLNINSWSESTAVSDEHGRYQMRVAAPGLPLVVMAAGHQQLLLQSYMPDDARVHERDFVLQPAAKLAGRVIDQDNRAVAGARVRSGGLLGAGTLTDELGYFTLDGARPGATHMITARKKGYQPGTTVVESGEENAVIQLEPGFSATLRVQGPDAQPLLGAHVYVVRSIYSGWESQGITAQDGAKQIDDMPPGSFDVIVQKKGFVRDRRTIDASKLNGEVLINLRRGFRIAGRVVNEDDAPLAGVSVFCELPEAEFGKREIGRRGTTDEHGRFEVTDLPPETCTIRALLEGYERTAVAGVRSGQQDLVLKMQPAPGIAGRVLDGRTGQPIAGFTIQVVADPSVRPVYLDPSLFDDANGDWRIQHGKMRTDTELFVEVWANGYAPSRFRTVARRNPTRKQNVVRLFPATKVVGVLRDQNTGDPIANARLELNHGDASEDLHRYFADRTRAVPAALRQTTTASDGSFELACAASGSNRLHAKHDGYPNRTFGPFEIQPGADIVEIQPTMVSGVALRGRIEGLKAFDGCKVRAFCLEQEANVTSKVGKDGSFAFAGLGPGDYRIVLSNRSTRSHSLRVAVGSEDVEEVVLRVQSGTGSVRATVIGLQSGHAEIRAIGAQAADGGTAERLEFEQGTFVFEGLPAGRYRILVHAAGLPGSGRAELLVGDDEVATTVSYEAR